MCFIMNGQSLGDPADLVFRDPSSFRAGELHAHAAYWETLVGHSPTPQQARVLSWIRDKVSICPQWQHYKGVFKGRAYDSDRPPVSYFSNNPTFFEIVDSI
jgi:hypothetical protein